MIDLTRARRKPFDHQQRGVEVMAPLVDPGRNRLIPGCFLLADEMRLGKTKQIIDLAQVLFTNNEITTVIVVAPAPVRDVWYDPEIGEIQKHRWLGFPTLVTEYHSVIRKWAVDTDKEPTRLVKYLTWIITNYEYIRYGLKNTTSGWRGPHLLPLLNYATPKTMLVLDESSALAHYDSLQTRACLSLRKKCGRVIELNGTPIVETPEDLFSQAKVLDPRILGFNHISQYRARYAIMGGYEVPEYEWKFGRKVQKFKVDPKTGRKLPVLRPVEVMGWRHKPRPGCCDIPEFVESAVHGPGPGLEEIQEKLAPYILRRVRSECLDLPPKLDPVNLTATLKPETWRMYREMREELVAWLDSHTVATAAQAGNKVMRLAQITSGFLGGLRDEESACPECGGEGVQLLGPALDGREGLDIPPPAPAGPGSELILAPDCPSCGGSGTISALSEPKAVGREKLDLFMEWIKRRLKEEPEFRMVVWCRFRFELHRTVDEVRREFPGIRVCAIHGGQTGQFKQDRIDGLRLMHSDTPPYRGPAILFATEGTGGQGTNMAGAHEVVYLSHGNSLFKRRQSEDRPHGPGQTSPVSYHNFVAVGPKGQKTIDHDVLKALRGKEELANWTCSAWADVLRKEEK